MALARAPARSPRSAGEAMTPNLELMLETIERALAVAILPAAGNASAREEASLAILFTRWIRDVVDHVADAERASYRDCRATLAAVRSEEHTSELQSPDHLVCRLLLEKKKKKT